MKPRLEAAFIPWRFYLIVTILFCVVFGLITRMFDLTIVKRSFLQHEGDIRVERVVSSTAFRGMILDRNGYPLAVSTDVFSIWVNPKDYLNTSTNNRLLGQQLSLQPNLITAAIKQAALKHRQFTYIKRDVPPEVAKRIAKLKLPGLFLQEESKRYYPEGEVASHVVGFTNIDDKGQEGLELSYNPWLSGVIGKTLVIKDRHGRSISNLQTLQGSKPGKNLVLSIDKRIQYLAYRELMAGLKENVAPSGSVVVLDTQTGEILAMVNQPSFNPNNRVGDKADVFRNRALTDTFEPGSTIKAFTLASALDSGLYKPDMMIDTNPGWVRVERHTVQDEHNFGAISVARVLQLSSNVGVTKIVLSLPQQQLWGLLHRVGFGETTGVGFPGEQSGSLVKRKNWHPFALATLAFGYGISVTPMQLAQAYAIFANLGIKKPVSLLRVDTPPEGTQVMDPKIANEMLNLLEADTISKGATGAFARVPGYRVAGKTGTARMLGPHGYLKHHHNSTFVGIAPVSHPRIVVAVVIHDPQGKHYYASYVSAPVFEKIMEGSLRILNIPPDDLGSLTGLPTPVAPGLKTHPLQQAFAGAAQ